MSAMTAHVIAAIEAADAKVVRTGSKVRSKGALYINGKFRRVQTATVASVYAPADWQYWNKGGPKARLEMYAPTTVARIVTRYGSCEVNVNALEVISL